MTRTITLISLLTIMLAANVGWRAIASQNAENLHTEIIGTPYPPHCIYWDGSIAYDAPCQDYRIAIPLAQSAERDMFGPPPARYIDPYPGPVATSTPWPTLTPYVPTPAPYGGTP